MNIDAFEGLPAYPSAARAEIYACGRGLETHAESENGLACEVGFTTEQLLTMLATLPVFGAEVATDTDAQGNIRARVSYCGHVAHIERKGRYIRVSSETPLGKTPCAVMQNYHDTEKEAFEEYLRRLQACPGVTVYIKRAGR
ncbi:MAG: hypothetical protein IJM56_11055, partial [Clostridia bacterium]|nr:hypothetical protein [Clostridia bacterium]